MRLLKENANLNALCQSDLFRWYMDFVLNVGKNNNIEIRGINEFDINLLLKDHTNVDTTSAAIIKEVLKPIDGISKIEWIRNKFTFVVYTGYCHDSQTHISFVPIQGYIGNNAQVHQNLCSMYTGIISVENIVKENLQNIAPQEMPRYATYFMGKILDEKDISVTKHYFDENPKQKIQVDKVFRFNVNNDYLFNPLVPCCHPIYLQHKLNTFWNRSHEPETWTKFITDSSYKYKCNCIIIAGGLKFYRFNPKLQCIETRYVLQVPFAIHRIDVKYVGTRLFKLIPKLRPKNTQRDDDGNTDKDDLESETQE